MSSGGGGLKKLWKFLKKAKKATKSKEASGAGSGTEAATSSPAQAPSTPKGAAAAAAAAAAPFPTAKYVPRSSRASAAASAAAAAAAAQRKLQTDYASTALTRAMEAARAAGATLESIRALPPMPALPDLPAMGSGPGSPMAAGSPRVTAPAMATVGAASSAGPAAAAAEALPNAEVDQAMSKTNEALGDAQQAQQEFLDAVSRIREKLRLLQELQAAELAFAKSRTSANQGVAGAASPAGGAGGGSADGRPSGTMVLSPTGAVPAPGSQGPDASISVRAAAEAAGDGNAAMQGVGKPPLPHMASPSANPALEELKQELVAAVAQARSAASDLAKPKRSLSKASSYANRSLSKQGSHQGARAGGPAGIELMSNGSEALSHSQVNMVSTSQLEERLGVLAIAEATSSDDTSDDSDSDTESDSDLSDVGADGDVFYDYRGASGGGTSQGPRSGRSGTTAGGGKSGGKGDELLQALLLGVDVELHDNLVAIGVFQHSNLLAELEEYVRSSPMRGSSMSVAELPALRHRSDTQAAAHAAAKELAALREELAARVCSAPRMEAPSFAMADHILNQIHAGRRRSEPGSMPGTPARASVSGAAVV